MQKLSFLARNISEITETLQVKNQQEIIEKPSQCLREELLGMFSVNMYVFNM